MIIDRGRKYKKDFLSGICVIKICVTFGARIVDVEKGLEFTPMWPRKEGA